MEQNMKVYDQNLELITCLGVRTKGMLNCDDEEISLQRSTRLLLVKQRQRYSDWVPMIEYQYNSLENAY